MRVPMGWLKEFVEFDLDARELARRMTMAGLEVSELAAERFGFDNAFVGVVTSSERLPGRDDFVVLSISTGERSLKVVTNLTAFRGGDALPVAAPGFVFPDGTVLEPKRMYGVLSDGKILAEADLEISGRDDVVAALPRGAAAGANVADVLGITELVLKFDLTSNRGDCQSVFGIAREAAAVLGATLRKSPYAVSPDFAPGGGDFEVRLRDPALCPRYTGRLIEGVTTGQSPPWMRRRLIACGMRPISNIVDVTNYVLLETGQPLHAFDMDTLEGGRIVVRRAGRGERLVTIDGVDRALPPETLVIADARRPVAVAGVMGGADTAVSDATRRILLESAFFDPVGIRRTSRRLDLRTESSVRFEKVVDPLRVADASNRAARVIKDNGWGAPLQPMRDVFPRVPKETTVRTAAKKINFILGTAIEPAAMETLLKNASFSVERTGGAMKVRVPSHRRDVSIPEDVAEEVARLYGYDRIPSELPEVRTHRASMAPGFHVRDRLHALMVEAGLDETYSFGFTNVNELKSVYGEGGVPRAVAIINPLTEDFTHLRGSLVPGLLRACRGNFARGVEDVFLFELGRIYFYAPDGAPSERDSLAFAASGCHWRPTTRSAPSPPPADFYYARGIVESVLDRITAAQPRFEPATSPLYHPGRSAEAMVGGVKVAEFGEVHPSVLNRLEIKRVVCAGVFEPDALAGLMGEERRHAPVSRFPAVTRDLSVIVGDDVAAARAGEAIRAAAGEWLEELEVVDVYRSDAVGEGMKSVTFTMRFRHRERTLGDEEVNERMEAVVRALAERVGGIVREKHRV
ncbi:MAG: phenylalanine--tRNA ligase subunit beta [bacterium]